MKTVDENFTPEIFYIVFRKCTPTWHIYQQELKNCNLTYIVKGNARYTFAGAAYDLGPGDLVCLPMNSIRAAVTFPDRLMHCFSVDFNLKNSQMEYINLPFPLVSHIGIINDLVHLFHELTYTWVEKPPGYTIKDSGLLLLILHRLYKLLVYDKDLASVDFRVEKALHYVANHYAEKPTIKEIAKIVGLNPVYFGNLFKKETGNSLKHHLIKTKVNNAENLLISGEYTVEETAELCGYEDKFHFYKQFKAIKGFPPSMCIPKFGG
jgi:AraC-like DNA-binding protein